MRIGRDRRESSLRVVLPPAVLVAVLWIGLQTLLLVFFHAVLLYPTMPGPSRGEFMSRVLTGSPAAEPVLAAVLLAVNLLFVALIWLKQFSPRTRSRPESLAAMITIVAVTVLLLLVQWQWLELLRSLSYPPG